MINRKRFFFISDSKWLLVALWLTMLTFFFAANPSFAATTVTNPDALKDFLVRAIANQQTTVAVKYTGPGREITNFQLGRIIQAAMRASDDYIHYTIGSYATKTKVASKGPSTVNVQFQYRETKAQAAVVDQKVKEVIAEVITEEMDHHQKVKAVHDWVVLNFAYDKTLRARSAYDGVISGKTVCEGYAMFTYKVLKALKIPVRIVEGRGRGVLHAWNLVQLDGSWYHLDSTWNDPVPDEEGRVEYQYYMLTDQQIRKDHSISSVFGYPKATSDYLLAVRQLIETQSNPDQKRFYESLYQSIGGQWFADENTVKDVAAMKASIEKAVSEGTKEIRFRYLRGGSATIDLKRVLRELNIGATYSIEKFQRSQSLSEVLMTIKFMED